MSVDELTRIKAAINPPPATPSVSRPPEIDTDVAVVRKLAPQKKDASSSAKVGVAAASQRNLDEVKKMDEIALAARCQAERDKQLAEKQALKAKEAMENKKIEQMMEEIRIREIQERELIEKNHKIEMQRGAESIRQQMEYRENLKKHDRELRNQEQRVMLDKIQQERDREQAEIAAKKEAQRQRLIEVKKDNENAMISRKEAREREKAETRTVLEYVDNKGEEERKKKAEVERKRLDKENAALRRYNQAKVTWQKQADKDEQSANMQAKLREAEEVERTEREKQQSKEKARAAMEGNALLMKQKEEAKRREHERLEIERQEIAKLQEQRKKEDQDALEAAKRKKLENREFMQKQMQMKEERLAREQIVEIQQVKDNEEDRHAVLEQAKKEKIEKLRKEGVPDSYLNELKKMKV